MKTKFYHCSPKRFKKGDVLISPANDEDHNFPGQGHDGVFLNTSPVPHFTIWTIITKKWHVYEVNPVGRLSYGTWDDIICESAIVEKRVGSAKGILDKYKSRLKPVTYTDLDTGETVVSDDVYMNEKAYVNRKSWRGMKKKW